MDTDRIEQLQRSIDALLARIEAQKLTLGSLLRDRGPLLASWSSGATASIEAASTGAGIVR